VDWKLEVVVVPVADVERSKRFYTEQVGFVVDYDTRVSDDVRIVQLTPPGSACSIVIGVGDAAPGSVSGLQLVVSDIQAAREQLLAGRVDASVVRHVADGDWVDGHGGSWNAFVFFSDPDGNDWTVQERPAG